MNFEKLRGTDMSTCRCIYPPAPLSTDKTIVLRNMTDKVLIVTRDNNNSNKLVMR